MKEEIGLETIKLGGGLPARVCRWRQCIPKRGENWGKRLQL